MFFPYSKKKRSVIFIIFLAFILLGAWFVIEFDRADSETTIKQVQVRSEAEATAIKFLSKQTFASDYEELPSKVENFSDFWSVWFDKKDRSARPNKGLVQIDKDTGQATWMPLN